jgi:hypothetical protein
MAASATVVAQASSEPPLPPRWNETWWSERKSTGAMILIEPA